MQILSPASGRQALLSADSGGVLRPDRGQRRDVLAGDVGELVDFLRVVAGDALRVDALHIDRFGKLRAMAELAAEFSLRLHPLAHEAEHLRQDGEIGLPDRLRHRGGRGELGLCQLHAAFQQFGGAQGFLPSRNRWTARPSTSSSWPPPRLAMLPCRRMVAPRVSGLDPDQACPAGSCDRLPFLAPDCAGSWEQEGELTVGADRLNLWASLRS